MKMSGVTIESLSHSWDNFALTDINLSVAQGSYFVLLGPTGSGKTLLLEAIVGGYRPKEGRITVNGKNVTNLPPEKREISYAPQNYLLFDTMTVQKNVEFGLYAKGIPEVERRDRTKRLLGLLGISHLTNRFPRSLSGGERQRVSLARALAVEPRAVLLDEPLSSVDAATKSSILGYLRDVHKETGVTIIHVTHDNLEAAAVADQVGVIGNGKIVQLGTPTEVVGNPSPAASTIFHAENLIEGTVVGKESGLALVDIGEGKIIEALTDQVGTVTLHIRPEDIIVAKRAVDSSARNQLSGKVTEIADLGAIVRLRISGERLITATITKRSFFEMQLNIGSQVRAIFKTTSVEVL
jgi:molybdate/tungstate transport system ATP-binding protein